jgi:cytochrome c oxidase subunit 2
MSSKSEHRILAFLGVAALFLAGCAGSPAGPARPVTEQANRMAWLWSVFLWVAVCIGVLVWGLIVWSIIRYRRKRDETDLPGQFRSNVRLEIIYTGIPIIIVFVLFLFTSGVIGDVNRISDNPDLVVEVTGFQWSWQFTYPDEGITVTGAPDRQPVLVMPVDETVRLELTSLDVIHSFFVPDFLEKRDVFPGTVQELDLKVTEPGTYQGRCAEFCGIYHDRMLFQVEVVTRSEFDAWVASQTNKETQ